MQNIETLGTFEIMLMLALLRVGKDAYGVPMAREIESVTGKTVSLGSVYATLDRLAEKGLVSSTVGEPTAQRGGRAKRYFHVTGKGLRAIRNTQQILADLARGIPQLRGETA